MDLKTGWEVWSGFIWLSIRTSSRLLRTLEYFQGPQNVPSLSDKLLASQGLCCMEFVTFRSQSYGSCLCRQIAYSLAHQTRSRSTDRRAEWIYPQNCRLSFLKKMGLCSYVKYLKFIPFNAPSHMHFHACYFWSLTTDNSKVSYLGECNNIVWGVKNKGCGSFKVFVAVWLGHCSSRMWLCR
jgi:hypothetical protein